MWLPRPGSTRAGRGMDGGISATGGGAVPGDEMPVMVGPAGLNSTISSSWRISGGERGEEETQASIAERKISFDLAMTMTGQQQMLSHKQSQMLQICCCDAIPTGPMGYEATQDKAL